MSKSDLALALVVEMFDEYRASHGCIPECPFRDCCRMNEPGRDPSDVDGLCRPIAECFMLRSKDILSIIER